MFPLVANAALQCNDNDAGYGETLGEPEVISQFDKYVDMKDINPARVTLTDEHVDDFLMLLTKQGLREDDEGQELLAHARNDTLQSFVFTSHFVASGLYCSH